MLNIVYKGMMKSMLNETFKNRVFVNNCEYTIRKKEEKCET